MKCVGCGLCSMDGSDKDKTMGQNAIGFWEKIEGEQECVLESEYEHELYKQEYSVGHAVDDLRKKSAAGGVVVALLESMIQQGGYVCFPTFDAVEGARYILTDRMQDVNRIMLPIYVQNNIGEVLDEIENLLERDTEILFVGLPCQVMAIENKLSSKYSKLLTVCIKCNGMASAQMLIDALKAYNNESSNVINVSFFNKEKYGWELGKRIITLTYEDGKERELGFGEGFLFLEGIKKRVILNDCCYECNIRNYNEVGDIAVSDYNSELTDDQGFSALSINTSKGKELIDRSIEFLYLYEERCNQNEIKELFKNIMYNQKGTTMHEYFLSLYPQRSFDDAVYMSINNIHDIGIASGYATSNYGGALTQYAMYQVLRDMGYSTYLVERPKKAKNGADFANRLFPQYPYKEYELAPYYNSVDEMVEINKNCRMFLTGSDQFFNTYLYNATDQFFSLKWVYDYKPKVAYATSFGFDYLWDTEEQLAERAYYLQRFQNFSVREKSALKIAKEDLGVDADWVLDPVFLCNREHYEKIADDCTDKDRYTGDYVFAYILNPSPENERILNQVCDRLKMQVYIFSDVECRVKQYDKKWNLEVKTDADLPEWLWALKNSSYVITDSFHGTCFATIFSKDFISIVNRRRGATRFESILDLFREKDRMVEDAIDIDRKKELIIDKPVDYQYIDTVLKNERERCSKWLKNCISVALKSKKVSATYDFYLKHQKELGKIGNCRIYGGIGELGLQPGCTVDDIINKLPNNSGIHQVQGALGEPIKDTPVAYGILEIYRGTDYFIKVIFSQMTIEGKEPQIYQGKVKNKRIVSWERYVTNSEYVALSDRVKELEKDVEFLLRKYVKLL